MSSRRRSSVFFDEAEFTEQALLDDLLQDVDGKSYFEEELEKLQEEEKLAKLESEERMGQLRELQNRRNRYRLNLSNETSKRLPLVQIEDVGVLQEALAKAMFVIDELRKEKRECELKFHKLKEAVMLTFDKFDGGGGDEEDESGSRRVTDDESTTAQEDALLLQSLLPTQTITADTTEEPDTPKGEVDEKKAEEPPVKVAGGDAIVEEYLRLKEAQEKEEHLRKCESQRRSTASSNVESTESAPDTLIEDHSKEYDSPSLADEAPKPAPEGLKEEASDDEKGAAADGQAPAETKSVREDDTAVSVSKEEGGATHASANPKPEDGAVENATPPGQMDSEKGPEIKSSTVTGRVPGAAGEDAAGSQERKTPEEERLEREKKKREEKTKKLLSRFKADKAKHLKDAEDPSDLHRGTKKEANRRATTSPSREENPNHGRPAEKKKSPESKKTGTLTADEKLRQEKKAREAKTKKLLSRFKADKERHKKESEEDAKGSAPGRLLPKMTSFKKFFH